MRGRRPKRENYLARKRKVFSYLLDHDGEARWNALRNHFTEKTRKDPWGPTTLKKYTLDVMIVEGVVERQPRLTKQGAEVWYVIPKAQMEKLLPPDLYRFIQDTGFIAPQQDHDSTHLQIQSMFELNLMSIQAILMKGIATTLKEADQLKNDDLLEHVNFWFDTVIRRAVIAATGFAITYKEELLPLIDDLAETCKNQAVQRIHEIS